MGCVQTKPNNNYKMINVDVGEGGFAFYYKGVDKNTDKRVAIKRIERSDVKHVVNLDLKFMSCIKNPYVLNVHDFFQDEKCFYVVTDFCKGGNLDQRLKIRENGLEDWEVQAWARQILTGLKALHDQNVCHRNISLSNIMINEDASGGTCKLASFEKAAKYKGKLFTDKVGTPDSMSPEMHELPKGVGYELPTDVWSVGIVVAMLVARGKHPFKKDDGKLDMVRFRAGYGDFSPGFLDGIRARATGMNSADSEELLMKLLMPSPERRVDASKALNDSWLSPARFEKKFSK